MVQKVLHGICQICTLEFIRTGVYTHPSSPTTKTDNVLIDVQQEEYSDGDDVRAA